MLDSHDTHVCIYTIFRWVLFLLYLHWRNPWTKEMDIHGDISGHPILRLEMLLVSLEVASIPKDMSTLLAGASDGDGYPPNPTKNIRKGSLGGHFFEVEGAENLVNRRKSWTSFWSLSLVLYWGYDLIYSRLTSSLFSKTKDWRPPVLSYCWTKKLANYSWYCNKHMKNISELSFNY